MLTNGRCTRRVNKVCDAVKKRISTNNSVKPHIVRNILEYRWHVSQIDSPCIAVLFTKAAKVCRFVAHQLSGLAALITRCHRQRTCSRTACSTSCRVPTLSKGRVAHGTLSTRCRWACRATRPKSQRGTLGLSGLRDALERHCRTRTTRQCHLRIAIRSRQSPSVSTGNRRCCSLSLQQRAAALLSRGAHRWSSSLFLPLEQKAMHSALSLAGQSCVP